MTNPAALPSVFDATTWEQLADLIEGRDVSFLDELLRSYLDTADENVRILREGQDTKAMRRAAHTLFGSSVSLGVVSVAAICRKLEVELGRIPIKDMPDRLAKIETHLERVREQYPRALAAVAEQASERHPQ